MACRVELFPKPIPATSGLEVFPSVAVLFTWTKVDGSMELPEGTPEADLATVTGPLKLVPALKLLLPVKVWLVLSRATLAERRASGTEPLVKPAALAVSA